ncbi:hypothetical protein TrLO_g3947 [Triparma laevis f. longispina]|uniref:Sulfatase N-terminal domain-containing protein n=1 Tax=Triparma laevis f. longispina TaxID=1714387 RepID=A0A9W7FS68_9STRA|nr:hypothetical protein TrLO_g3947 [Triparma laevis f. longispina]
MPPNVIFFQPDDLPFYDGYIGQPTGAPNSPNRKIPPPSSGYPYYESIFESGVAFSNAQVVSPACGTSRYATLTGRYPSRSESGRTKTLNNDSSETRVQATIPFTKLMDSDSEQNAVQLFKAAGYKTGVAGKWHLTKSGSGSAGEKLREAKRRAGDTTIKVVQDEIKQCGFDFADGIYWENMGGIFVGDFTHNMEWVTEKAVGFIADAADAGQPFFLYFNPSVPHSPLVSDALENGDCLETPAGLLAEEPAVRHMTVDGSTGTAVSCATYRQTVEDRQDETQTSIIEQNLGGIWIDDSLAALMAMLDEKGIKDDTIIVTMMDHGIITKMALFENGNRVHLSMRYPKLGEYAENLIYDGQVTHLDLVATLMDICEMAGREGYEMDGESFLGDLQRVIGNRGSNNDKNLYPSSDDWSGTNRCTFAEYEWDRGAQNGYSTYNKQMYNVRVDGGESSNLLDASGNAISSSDVEMLAGLLRALQCHDSRTAPGADRRYVNCNLDGEDVDAGSPISSPTSSPTATMCLETNSGNCLSGANAGVACCDAGAQCERRDANFGQCKTTGCPYGRDPAWECETAAPTKAPTTSPPTVPPGSPSASPTTLTPTYEPHKQPHEFRRLDGDSDSYGYGVAHRK